MVIDWAGPLIKIERQIVQVDMLLTDKKDELALKKLAELRSQLCILENWIWDNRQARETKA